MEKLAKDVYALNTNGHSALLTASRLLIDTGVEDSAETLLSEIKACNYKPSDITHIIVTHTHPDHVSGLAKLKELSPTARIASHEIEAKYITRKEQYPGPPGPQRHRAVNVDDLLRDGQVYQGLLVLHTPGHTPGHISLFDQEGGILYAGDAFATSENDKCGPMPDKYNINPSQHVESMRKLSKLKFEKTIVGHGNPIGKQAALKLSNYFK